MCVKATFPLLEAAAAVNNTSLSKVQVILFFGVGVLSFFSFFSFHLMISDSPGGHFLSRTVQRTGAARRHYPVSPV